MKKATLVVVIVIFAALCGPALQASTTDTALGKSIEAKAATFAGETLTTDPSKMKDLAKALSTLKGILAAKLNQDTKALNVVFDPEKVSIDAIEKVLRDQLDDLERTGLKDTTWEAKDCGKCPSASKCAGKDKAK